MQSWASSPPSGRSCPISRRKGSASKGGFRRSAVSGIGLRAPEESAMHDYHYDAPTRFETKAESSPDEGWATFSGIASSGDRDLMQDRIQPGAFDPIQVELIPMLMGHDVSAPIGKWLEIR